MAVEGGMKCLDFITRFYLSNELASSTVETTLVPVGLESTGDRCCGWHCGAGWDGWPRGMVSAASDATSLRTFEHEGSGLRDGFRAGIGGKA